MSYQARRERTASVVRRHRSRREASARNEARKSVAAGFLLAAAFLVIVASAAVLRDGGRNETSATPIEASQDVRGESVIETITGYNARLEAATR